MKVVNRANLSPDVFETISQELEQHRSVLDILKWARKQPSSDLLPEIISEFIVQDEFSHDLVVPWKKMYLVYGTTCLGAVNAIGIWDHAPTADELLSTRMNEGWRPTPSSLQDGDRILGHAASLHSKSN